MESHENKKEPPVQYPKAITQKEMAERIGVSARTLSTWDKEKVFVARRNPNHRPFYIESDVQRYFDEALERGINMESREMCDNEDQGVE